jgi:hypothetical protein
MKRARIFFALPIAILSISLSLTSLVPAVGAAKAGSLCKKAGITEISSGKLFTCIKSGKKLLWNKGVTVQSPVPSTSASASPTLTPTESQANYLNSPEELNVCRVPDKRTTKTGAVAAIAYPVSSGTYPPAVPNLGSVNVAIIPIDFSDVPGKGSPSTLLDPEIAQINKWIKHFSNGKTSYNIQTSTKWIRASKPSTQYQWEHPGNTGNPLPESQRGPYRTPTEIATDLMRDAQNDFDYTNLKIVFFVYPKEVSAIWDAITNVGGVETNKGRVNIQINAAGKWLYSSNFPIWAWFLHENLHPTGLAGHAPMDASPFNIMTNQAGAALVLSAWDQAILDWQGDNQIYCVSQSNLSETLIPMNSIDNDSQAGTKAIFIKISDHEVIVVESHRRAYWSQGWLGYPGLPEDMKGLLVYKVDTTVDKNRVMEGPAFAQLLPIEGGSSDNYFGPYSPPFPMKYFVKVGQTVKSSGVTITLVKSGSYDTVKVSKS